MIQCSSFYPLAFRVVKEAMEAKNDSIDRRLSRNQKGIDIPHHEGPKRTKFIIKISDPFVTFVRCVVGRISVQHASLRNRELRA